MIRVKDLTYSDDIEIYSYYLGEDNVELGLGICSILSAEIRGKKDNSPSFWLYEGTRYGKDCIKWFDAGAQLSGDSIKLVELMEGLNFRLAMKFYEEKIRGKTNTLNLARQSIKKPKSNYNLILNNHFNEGELRYWKERYDITEKELITENIYSLHSLSWVEGFISDQSTNTDPAFVYRYSSEAWKIYAPLRKNVKLEDMESSPRGVKRKWISKGISSVKFPDGYHLLPKHKVDTIYICSSKKDAMVVKKLGYYALAQISESSIKRFLNNWGEIKERATYFEVLPDGDAAGQRTAQRLKEKLNINSKQLSYPEGTKDLAEVVETYNYQTLKQIII